MNDKINIRHTLKELKLARNILVKQRFELDSRIIEIDEKLDCLNKNLCVILEAERNTR
jgi:hypothetical protein